MLQESTQILLVKIVHSLETSGEAGWDDQIEFGQECLYEMHQMTRPLYQAYKATSSNRWPTQIPHSEGLHRAMPHVKAMVRAIRRSDRATAVESGKAALAEMNGSGESIPSACSTEPRSGSKEAPTIVQRQARRIRVSSGKSECQ